MARFGSSSERSESSLVIQEVRPRNSDVDSDSNDSSTNDTNNSEVGEIEPGQDQSFDGGHVGVQNILNSLDASCNGHLENLGQIDGNDSPPSGSDIELDIPSPSRDVKKLFGAAKRKASGRITAKPRYAAGRSPSKTPPQRAYKLKQASQRSVHQLSSSDSEEDAGKEQRQKAFRVESNSDVEEDLDDIFKKSTDVSKLKGVSKIKKENVLTSLSNTQTTKIRESKLRRRLFHETHVKDEDSVEKKSHFQSINLIVPIRKEEKNEKSIGQTKTTKTTKTSTQSAPKSAGTDASTSSMPRSSSFSYRNPRHLKGIPIKIGGEKYESHHGNASKVDTSDSDIEFEMEPVNEKSGERHDYQPMRKSLRGTTIFTYAHVKNSRKRSIYSDNSSDSDHSCIPPKSPTRKKSKISQFYRASENVSMNQCICFSKCNS